MLHLAEIKRIACEVGFDACGVAQADTLTDSEYPLREWLSRGWHGELRYMERNVEKRMDPRLLLPGAQSVICCVSAYPPPSEAENGKWKSENGGKIAAYARGREYHKVVKEMLVELRQRLGVEAKACCDTVPISDKRWAARAGLGWIGRHTLLVTPQWGSWVNLGELVTTEQCDGYDEPLPSHCTDCNLCVDACPNHALAPLAHADSFALDVRRCTAYYTTHNPKPLPPDVDAHGYTLGCDICQTACPYNQQQH